MPFSPPTPDSLIEEKSFEPPAPDALIEKETKSVPIDLTAGGRLTTGPFGEIISAPTGMEAGTEFTTALASGAQRGAAKAGKALTTAGKTARDIAAAYFFEGLGEPELQAAQLGISPEAVKQAGMVPEPEEPGKTPIELGMESLPAAAQIPSRAAYGLIEAAPRIAAVAGAQALGVPAPIAAAAAFGLTEEGFSPKEAAIAGALPFVGRYSGAIAQVVAKRLGVSLPEALTVVKGLGAVGVPAAALAAEQELEIRKLPQEQQHQARLDMWANIAGMSALGLFDVKPVKKGVPDAIQRETETVLQPVPTQPGEGVREMPITQGRSETVEGGKPTGGVEERPTTGEVSLNEPAKIADNMGARFDGETTSPRGKLWRFTTFDDKGNVSTSFHTEAGATPEQVRAKYNETRARYEGEEGGPRPLAYEESPLQSGEEAARQTGLTFKPTGVMGTEGMSPEMAAQMPKLWEFTDRRKGSPTEGLTIYVPEGASTENILSAWKKKQAEAAGAAVPTQVSPAINQSADNQVQSGKIMIPGQKPETIGAGIRKAVEKGGEAGAIQLPTRQQVQQLFQGAAAGVKTAFNEVKAIADEVYKIKATDDYHRSVLGWSGKLQQAFGEADRIKRDIQKRVPKEIDRDGITNWIQANGDRAVLTQRMQATTDPKLNAGYRAALNLSPEALNVAREVQNTYNNLHALGTTYGVLNAFRDNYVTQIWKTPLKSYFGSGRTLREAFRFAKQRSFENYFEGEQAGFSPKTKDIAKLLPSYKYELESVIAARQLAADLASGYASDGRRLVAPRGIGTQVGQPGSQATLVMPGISKGRLDMRGYETLAKQPALRDWQWVSRDQAGNDVFLKSDLAVHPDIYNHLKNVLGRSKIREWYRSSSEQAPLMAIPKKIVHALDFAQSETKRTMLGALSPFHQVQEATHAIGHRVNPFFNIPTIDMRNPAHLDAANHGLMLKPDSASANNFMEGLRVSGLISKIPGLGPVADYYQHFLFENYIPGLKYKTYEAILNRNNSVFARELRSGSVRPEDVKILSAMQANAAYGHLNYSYLGRNPTFQHFLRLAAVAPDFLEARMRFAGQALRGVTGAKVGREQILALGTLAIAQATASYISAKLTGGEWDPKHPFEFHTANRTYTLRSVPEDISQLISHTRQFVYSRLNPITGKVPTELLSGTDWRGQPITPKEVLKEAAKQPVPLSLRPLVGLGSGNDLRAWEQLAGAAGLKISRFSPSAEMYEKARDWKAASTDPKLKAQAEREAKEVHPESIYRPLKSALSRGDDKTALAEFKKLTEQGKSYGDITKAWQRDTPFTGSKDAEGQFYQSLSEADKQVYENARKERIELISKLSALLNKKTDKP